MNFFIYLLFSCLMVVGSGEELKVMGIGIVSKSDYAAKRQLLRDTWFRYPIMQSLGSPVEIRFFVASPSDPVQLKALLDESEKHGDIEVIGVKEHYDNVPLQVMRIAEYYSRDHPARFIMKTDDDVFVRVPHLLRYFGALPANRPEGEIWGWYVPESEPHRVGKYALTEEHYPEDKYPPWIGGPAYIFSRELAESIVITNNEEPLRSVRLEDVSMGLWIKQLQSRANTNVKFTDDRRFFKIRVCDERSFTSLVEEGRPLEMNVTWIMHDMFERDLAIEAGWPDTKGLRFCPLGTNLTEVSTRNKAKKAAELQARVESETLAQLAGIEPPSELMMAKVNITEQGPAEGERRIHQPVHTPLADITARSEGASTDARAKNAVEVLIYDHMGSNHPFINTHKLSGCDSIADKCVFSDDHARFHVADAVLFAGDTEYYTNSMRELPSKTSRAVLYGVVFREALPRFPVQWWNRYDFNITYHISTSLVAYSYADGVDFIIQSARNAKAFREEHADALSTDEYADVAFVALRCTGPGRQSRTAFVEELMKHTPVDSFGVCVNNKPWPENHRKDKSHVMRQARFCIAYENMSTEDYVTEKLFDCLRAGAIPIYKGPEPTNALQYIPGGRQSVVLIDEYASVKDVAKAIDEIRTNQTLYESYTAWIDEPPIEWVNFIRTIEGSSIRCRLCKALLG
eukprot:Rmarinus@m.19861